jgi:hypothetical protein
MAPVKSESTLPGWQMVGVELPPSVIAIITAAGGADPAKGGMPYAMASILGALPWIGVALFKELTPEQYAAFLNSVNANMRQVWAILSAEDPKAAFDAEYEAARRSLQ